MFFTIYVKIFIPNICRKEIKKRKDDGNGVECNDIEYNKMK